MCGIKCIVCTVREKDSWVLQGFDVIVSCSERRGCERKLGVNLCDLAHAIGVLVVVVSN